MAHNKIQFPFPFLNSKRVLNPHFKKIKIHYNVNFETVLNYLW